MSFVFYNYVDKHLCSLAASPDFYRSGQDIHSVLEAIEREEKGKKIICIEMQNLGEQTVRTPSGFTQMYSSRFKINYEGDKCNHTTVDACKLSLKAFRCKFKTKEEVVV